MRGSSSARGPAAPPAAFPLGVGARSAPPTSFPPPAAAPPVAPPPRRFGRVAAANALSDVYAMGGRPLFALNLCCFPELAGEGAQALGGGLRGAAEALVDAHAVLLGGHSVRDPELKFGLAVIGEADPQRLLTNAGAKPGDRLLLTKPLGTGIL